jgi:hypothetical protein
MSRSTSTIRTFLDSGVLIAGFRASGEMFRRAFTILDDPNRIFISSDFIRLEIMTKPTFFRRPEETAYYERFFLSTTTWVGYSPDLFQRAYDIGCQFGLNALDALHIAAATLSQSQEFVTTERHNGPFSRIPHSLITVRSIHVRQA